MSAEAAAQPAKTRGFLRRLLAQPVAALSLAWLGLVVLAAVAAPLLAPYGPLEADLADVLAGPSFDHPLGTDPLGRDTLSRLMHGGGDALLGVVEAVAVFVLIGSAVGLAAGFLGGWFDRLTGLAVSVVMAVPVLIVLLVVLSVFPHNEHLAMITAGLLYSPLLIRVTQAQARGVREQLYVAAARVSGLSDRQILARHILPRVIGTIVVQASFFAGIALVLQAALSFLGLGAEAPDPSWGGSISEAAGVIQLDTWPLVPPGVVIALTVLALGLLGDAIRDTSTELWSGSRLAPPRRGARGRPAPDPDDPLASVPLDADALLSVDRLTVEVMRGDDPPLTLVQSASFDIRPGETVGLVGESGCGKTVTALSLLGFLPGNGRCSGRVLFDGRDLTTLSEREFGSVRGGEIAFVSQEPMVALDPTFSVGQILVEAVRRHHGGSRKAARTRALELLEMARLPDPQEVARRYPHQLSGGMAQRVCVALALAGNPRLLIADEPTTALDVTVQAEILDLLRALQAETGMSILLVTHDWGVVADICQRAVVMYAGQVVERAPVEEIFAEPLHPYTRGLLGADPHRMLELEPEATQVRLPTIAGTVPPPGEWPLGCHFHPRCPLAREDCRVAPVAASPIAEGRRLSRCLHWTELAQEKVGG